jgi:hypothetical protein
VILFEALSANGMHICHCKKRFEAHIFSPTLELEICDEYEFHTALCEDLPVSPHDFAKPRQVAVAACGDVGGR